MFSPGLVEVGVWTLIGTVLWTVVRTVGVSAGDGGYNKLNPQKILIIIHYLYFNFNKKVIILLPVFLRVELYPSSPSSVT